MERSIFSESIRSSSLSMASFRSPAVLRVLTSWVISLYVMFLRFILFSKFWTCLLYQGPKQDNNFLILLSFHCEIGSSLVLLGMTESARPYLFLSFRATRGNLAFRQDWYSMVFYHFLWWYEYPYHRSRFIAKVSGCNFFWIRVKEKEGYLAISFH